MATHKTEKQEWSIRAPDIITIRRAMNGFTVEPGERLPAMSAPLPYVFESSESLFEWISDNFICEDPDSEERQDTDREGQ